jgi:outer membrane protein OmpA-like peptidoglycan-associated protein
MRDIIDYKIEQIREIYGTDVSIVCEGHTCDTGKDAYNLQLGQKRADEVRRFLISRGFKYDKITAISKGQYLPIVPNTTESNKKKNRRVMLIIKE